MRRNLILAMSALTALSGCQAIGQAYTRAFGSAPVQKPAELVPFQASATLRVLWQGNVGAAEKNVYFPARSGRIVYAVGAAGSVTGFDASSGAIATRFDAGERVSGGIGAGAGMLLVGTSKGQVLAFSEAGKPLWRAQLPGEVLAPPQAGDGTVVVRTGDSRVYGLDAASGKRRWVYERTTPALTVRSHAGLVVERGAVFVGFPGGRLVGMTLSDGKVGWDAVVTLPRGATELERIADITSLPVADGPRICAAAYQGRVACFDATRGTLLWARDVSSLAGIGVDERYLYVTDDRNAVLAFDKSSGASLWRQDRLAGRNVSGPLAVGRYVVVGDLQGYVHVLSRDDGAFAARLPTDGSAILAPPVALDASSFVVQTRAGGVFAIAIQ